MGATSGCAAAHLSNPLHNRLHLHMQILFIHQNFPGQFLHLSARLAQLGHEVHALGITPKPVRGVKVHAYKLPPLKEVKPFPAFLGEMQGKFARAEACMRALMVLRSKAGLDPDLVVVHPGWGEALFARDVFPRARHLHFLEFFYRAEGQDMNFDPEFVRPQQPMEEQHAMLRVKNVSGLVSLDVMDHGLSPTRWQASTYPAAVQDRIDVIFDGIDTQVIAPDPQARFQVPGGPLLSPADEVVSFINRNLEPYRGYHVFMRALPELMRLRPQARFVVVGDDGVSYGARAPRGKTWKQIFLDEVVGRIDASRLHFVGTLPRRDLTALLQVSSCHVYLTYPFVMSWSGVEAMSAGCPLVASDTAPVREFVTDGVHGRLFDFFDPQALAGTVAETLEHRTAALVRAARARERIVREYDLNQVCLPRQIALLERLHAQR